MRERKEDIPLLVDYLIPNLNRDLKTRVDRISDDALELFGRYDWPGNVRELGNALERAMLLADSDNCFTITTEHLCFMKIKRYSSDQSAKTLRTLMRDHEKQILEGVLKETNYNKTKTAKILDIDLSWLYKKVKQYGLSVDKS